MKLALLVAASRSPACVDGSPLSRSMVDVWVNADLTATPPTVQVDARCDRPPRRVRRCSFGRRDRRELDGSALVLDPQTGFTQQGGDYSAVFDLRRPAARETPGSVTPTRRGRRSSSRTARPRVTHSSSGLFTNDLAPVAPIDRRRQHVRVAEREADERRRPRDRIGLPRGRGPLVALHVVRGPQPGRHLAAIRDAAERRGSPAIRSS